MAKAAIWRRPDAETRRRGEQTGLDTLVVHAVNDAYPVSGCGKPRFGAPAYAMSMPPGDYERKLKTQRN